MDQDITNIINLLKEEGVGVLPTDTLYGLVGLALNQKVVEKIYKIKQRSPEKPFIILISSLDDLKRFNIEINQQTKDFLEKNWPGPLSVILPCPDKKFEYLHKGIKTLAFRIPNYPLILDILKQTGPLVAPSANPEGSSPAQNIKQAKEYFDDNVSFYLDKGKLISKPSTIIKIEDNKIIVLRQGKYKVSELSL
ncbi:MAG: L-threonylcarbamoyladenylate synthase [Candidatus Daviesbacteria bacterium]